MYTTIDDVVTDYRNAADAAGVPENEQLSEDAILDICHDLGRYEELDRDELFDHLWLATGGEDLRDAIASNS